MSTPQLTSCHCCGLVQKLPTLLPGQRLICSRCQTPLTHINRSSNHWSTVLSISALAFYLPAMGLPLLRIEQLGHRHEDSLLSGVIALLSGGYWLVGSVIFIFSVLLPPLKLLALLLLPRISQHHHRALAYRAVELLGRWGMLDVMLVAILVAFVKLGDLVSINAGPGLIAFILLVLFSLLASFTFNPHHRWEE